MLTIHNLSKKFAGNDFYSLRNVNLEINKGEIVGLIGKNGAGKSTLMKIIMRWYDPKVGQVLLSGQDHQTFHRQHLQASFAYVPQVAQLFHKQQKKHR